MVFTNALSALLNLMSKPDSIEASSRDKSWDDRERIEQHTEPLQERTGKLYSKKMDPLFCVNPRVAL